MRPKKPLRGNTRVSFNKQFKLPYTKLIAPILHREAYYKSNHLN